MEHVAFNEFYSLMNIAGIIIVEDQLSLICLESQLCMIV